MALRAKNTDQLHTLKLKTLWLRGWCVYCGVQMKAMYHGYWVCPNCAFTRTPNKKTLSSCDRCYHFSQCWERLHNKMWAACEYADYADLYRTYTFTLPELYATETKRLKNKERAEKRLAKRKAYKTQQ